MGRILSSEFSVDLLKSYQALNTGSVGKKHCINEGEKHSAMIAMETGLWGEDRDADTPSSLPTGGLWWSEGQQW